MGRGKRLDEAALQGRVAKARAAGADPRQLLADLARVIGEGFDAMGCDVYRCLPGEDSLRPATTWPTAAEGEGAWLGVVYPLAEWPAFRTIIGSPVATQVRGDSPDLSERERRDLAVWGIGATMGMRLETGGRVVGCLIVSRRKARGFEPEELAALERCAPPVAAALDWASPAS
jgi:GAF domain-containing protein